MAEGISETDGTVVDQNLPGPETPVDEEPAPAPRRRRSKAAAAPPPPVEELKAAAKEKDEDRAPAAPRRRGRPPGSKNRPREEAEPAPPFRAGPIARGVNRMYRKAGRMIKVMDPEIGAAIIDATTKDVDDEDDITVGEAWEEVARTNPRIRKFLLKLIAGGAYGSLFMCHAPILLAIMMKPAISRHIPFFKLVEALLSDEEDDEEDGGGLGQMFGDLRPEDMAQMMAMVQASPLAAMLGRMPAMPRQPAAEDVPTS